MAILVGCSSTPDAAPSSTAPATTTTSSAAPATPDPALIEGRLQKAQLPDDVLGPLGYTRKSDNEQKNYTIMSCPTELGTEGAMAMTKLATYWTNKAAFSAFSQYSVSFRRVDAAAESVTLARKALECRPFSIGKEGPFSPDGELTLPALGGDAQFAVCFKSELMRICELVVTKADLLTRFMFYGPATADAPGVLEKAGRAVVPLMSA
ncbi:hypothetical protein [Saccharothrix violaceirubra]|uniref:PknH-like protein n=1 Tax=Saccharothrix violaceirubra TaxID=413306 RepID=A0A7W7T3V7_9PSEU|nr:hypothetical protein [Saccharothrix violaceirubra]MBB4966021.1 hypothetical protein [Saccharothrix violaceirubra]